MQKKHHAVLIKQVAQLYKKVSTFTYSMISFDLKKVFKLDENKQNKQGIVELEVVWIELAEEVIKNVENKWMAKLDKWLYTTKQEYEISY